MAQQLKMTKTTWQSSTADFAPAPPGESRWIIRQWAASVFAPLCESMMSFTKPEVHNILHCCQRRTEPQPQVTCTLLQKISWSSDMSFRDMRADRHTDRQTQKETNLQTRISQYFAPSRWRSSTVWSLSISWSNTINKLTQSSSRCYKFVDSVGSILCNCCSERCYNCCSQSWTWISVSDKPYDPSLPIQVGNLWLNPSVDTFKPCPALVTTTQLSVYSAIKGSFTSHELNWTQLLHNCDLQFS